MLNVCKNIARDDNILFNSGKIKLLEKIVLEAEQCFQICVCRTIVTLKMYNIVHILTQPYQLQPVMSDIL